MDKDMKTNYDYIYIYIFMTIFQNLIMNLYDWFYESR